MVHSCIVYSMCQWLKVVMCCNGCQSWMADVKSSEHNLEGKQCVNVADEDDSLPPVRSASQTNHAHKVINLSICIAMLC